MYKILKVYINLALHFYFKKYQVHGLNNIPSGPTMFVANHQNAFLDALLVTCASSRNPYYLARASIFGKKWTSKILTSLKLIPIYRIRDGYGSLRKNNLVFEKCRGLLESGEAILVFPEGNHDNRFSLRQLQKGAARIAFDAESRNNFSLNLQIVPVGIQYEKYDGYGTNVLVNFGSPLPMKTLQKDYEENGSQAVLLLTNNIANSIRPLIIDIQPESHYSEIYRKWDERRSHENDLMARLEIDKKQIGDLTKGKLTPEEEKLYRNSSLIRRVVHWISLVISKVNFLIPDQWISYFIKNRLAEPNFEGSMRFALWALPGMLFFLFQVLIIYLLTSRFDITIVYFLLSIQIARIAIVSKSHT